MTIRCYFIAHVVDVGWVFVTGKLDKKMEDEL